MKLWGIHRSASRTIFPSGALRHCPNGDEVLHARAMTSHFATVQDPRRVNVSRLTFHEQYRATVQEDEQ